MNSCEQDYDASGNGVGAIYLTRQAATSMRLRPYFASGAQVLPMGCNTSQGRAGRHLLARMWRVPVSTASHKQYGGGAQTFAFEGRVYKNRPNGAISPVPGAVSSQRSSLNPTAFNCAAGQIRRFPLDHQRPRSSA